MNIKMKMTSAAEKLFDTNGFVATGMDRLTQAAGVSSRTLYKHHGSKTGLMVAVLEKRDQRFQKRLAVQSVSALFDALEKWLRVEGSHGCLFLRAMGETGGNEPEIAAIVHRHKDMLRQKVFDVVAVEIGSVSDDNLAEQILILFEGATAAAIYRGPDVVQAAQKAAEILMNHASLGE